MVSPFWKSFFLGSKATEFKSLEPQRQKYSRSLLFNWPDSNISKLLLELGSTTPKAWRCSMSTLKNVLISSKVRFLLFYEPVKEVCIFRKIKPQLKILINKFYQSLKSRRSNWDFFIESEISTPFELLNAECSTRMSAWRWSLWSLIASTLAWSPLVGTLKIFNRIKTLTNS